MVLPADATHQAHDLGEVNDMERLVTKADQVRKQIDELVTLRDTALTAAQAEARVVLEEANREAQRVIADADDTARDTIEQAHAAAGEMLRSVRDEMQQIVDAVTQRKTALDAAVSAIGNLPRVLSPITDETESPSSRPSEPGSSMWADDQWSENGAGIDG